MTRTVDDLPVLQAEVVRAPSAAEREYAAGKIESLTRYAPIRPARIALHPVADPRDPRSAEAEANLSGDGLFVHADARGESPAAAINLVRRRLYRLLTHQRRRPRHAASRTVLPPARRRG